MGVYAAGVPELQPTGREAVGPGRHGVLATQVAHSKVSSTDYLLVTLTSQMKLTVIECAFTDKI